MDKMETEGTSKVKLENWKEEEGSGWGYRGEKKIMVLDWRRSEMVVNSCLDNMEGRMRYGSDFPRRRKRGTIEWRWE